MKKIIRRFVFVLLSAMMLMLFCFASSASDNKIQTIKYDVTFGQTDARTMLSMINSFRTGDEAWYWNSDNKSKTVCKNLGELTYDYELEKVAMQRAAEIAISFSHTRPDGKSCFSLYPSVYYARGENIAAGHLSAFSVMEAWKETDLPYSGQGHRRNMLSDDFNAVGFAKIYVNGYYYWVQEFGYTTNKTEKIEAENQSKKVTVDVDFSNAEYSVSTTTKNMNIRCGEFRALPETNITFILPDAWPSVETKALAVTDFMSEDENLIFIDEDGICAKGEGDTKISATILGETYSIDIRCDHSYDDINIVYATCIESGIKTFTCSCGDTYTETIPATNHSNATTDSGKAPTTTEVGYTAGKYCPDCKVWIEGHEEIPVLHTHIYNVSIPQEPTCTEVGIKSFICSCGETYTEDIPAKGHIWAYKPAVEATCEKEGLTRGTYCGICGFVNESQNVIPAIGHNFKTVLEKATLTKGGMLNSVCYNCNSIKTISHFPLVNGFRLSAYEYVYDGTEKKPIVTVKDETGTELINGIDYTLTYDEGRTDIGEYKIKVTLMGNYEGVKELSFSVLPGKTSEFIATQTDNSITLKWEEVEGATGYRIYQYNSETGKYSAIKHTTGLSHTVKKLEAGTIYKFAVRAYAKYDSEVFWSASNEKLTICTKPGATTQINHTLSADSIKLSWKGVKGATGYRVYIRNNGKWETLITTKSTAYVCKIPENVTECTFAVKAYTRLDGKNYWASSYTKVKSILFPGVTKKITCSASYNSIKLEWNKVPRATGYRVYMWNSRLDKWDIIAKGTKKLSVRVNKLEAGKKYTFAVRAYIRTENGYLWSESYKKVKATTDKLKGRTNILQIHSVWSDKVYGKMTLGDSGCGIVSVVNAVYNLNGRLINPHEIADWAYKNKLYNRGGNGGAMLELVPEVCKKFGNKYGFKLAATYTNYGTLKSSSSARKAMINHIENGGVVVAHVYYHYLAIVDYDAESGKFLVFDPFPGSYYGEDTGSRRYGYTTQNGDWKTSAELSVYPLDLDRFYLISAK